MSPLAASCAGPQHFLIPDSIPVTYGYVGRTGPAAGLETANDPKGTTMSDAPVLTGLNHVADLDAAGDFEKKHTPYISCVREGDKVRVTVKVGHWVSHPNLPDHFIEWIAVHAAGVPVARFDFSAVAVDPDITCVLDVAPGTPLAAMESCNLHGLWLAETVAP